MEKDVFEPANLLAINLLERIGVIDPSQKTIAMIETALSHVVMKQRLSLEPSLNKKEGACLFWAAKGKTIQETATLMGVTPTKVETCRRRIKRKLKATSIAQAVFEGMRFGYLPEPSRNPVSTAQSSEGTQK